METKQITAEQYVFVKTLAKDFRAENGKEFYVYCGTMFPSDYCHFLGLDYETLRLLGEVSYAMTYYETEDKEENKKYELACETYIDNFMNGKLSFTLEDSEDYLGFFAKKEEQEIGKAQWLPSNWKELMSDEQKEEIAHEWCKDNSCELEDYLDNDDKERIADDYIEQNNSDALDKAYGCLSSDEQREFIKDCIDNL